MEFVKFESARDKEKLRQELRDAREKMLSDVQRKAALRNQLEIQKDFSGESTWMLPELSNKIKKMNSKSSKKSKHKKKQKKQSKKRKEKCKNSDESSDLSSDSDAGSDSSNSSEDKHKHSSKSRSKSKKNKDRAHKKSKNKRKRKQSTSSSSSSSDTSTNSNEWAEKHVTLENTKQITNPAEGIKRDSWMTESFSLKTFSRERTNKPKERPAAYDPATSTRELNPYWKTTGTGLPKFEKPKEDNDSEDEGNYNKQHMNKSQSRYTSKSWQKTNSIPNEQMPQCNRSNIIPRNVHSKLEIESSQESDSNSDEPTLNQKEMPILTDQEMNELGAKIIKAEIMGQTALQASLKAKLESARAARANHKERKQNDLNQENKAKHKKEEHILLTQTDEKGNSRPLTSRRVFDERDLYGGRKGRKKQQKRVDTHLDGERLRYFADDDKYDIKQMFEREKFSTAADANLEFADIASKHKNPNDDLVDIFADNIRKNVSEEQSNKKEFNRAVHEHEKLHKQLENCEKCFDSQKMDKKLLVSIGDKIYMSLPWHIGLQSGHCIICPMQHIRCSTQLDEDSWEELTNFRRALTRMFATQRKDVIFFEIANRFHQRQHMRIHCIPIDEKDSEMAPFYFKKAIEESEKEWCVNKQLVSLRNKGLRNSIPKGLPYFWVNFGMDSGFAHVIEDQDRFPPNFAQEIIGGMLQLDTNKWRKPQKEKDAIAKVKLFASWWKQFDCTKQ